MHKPWMWCRNTQSDHIAGTFRARRQQQLLRPNIRPIRERRACTLEAGGGGYKFVNAKRAFVNSRRVDILRAQTKVHLAGPCSLPFSCRNSRFRKAGSLTVEVNANYPCELESQQSSPSLPHLKPHYQLSLLPAALDETAWSPEVGCPEAPGKQLAAATV